MDFRRFLIKDFHKVLDDAAYLYDYLLEQNKDLHKQLDNYNKDAEIQKLQKENESLYRHSLMQLSDVEMTSWIFDCN